MKSIFRKDKNYNIFFPVILIIILSGFILTGFIYLNNYYEEYNKEVEHRLTVVANLKMDELVQWRKERLSDGAIFYKNYYFSDLVLRYIHNPTDIESSKAILTWMKQFKHVYEYDAVELLDTQFNKRLIVSERNEPTEAFIEKEITETLKSGRMGFQDFFVSKTDSKIYLQVLVPILTEQSANNLIGIIVLRINPEIALYPLINNWPIVSKSGETLLIRREGSDVVFLNELRFKKNTALKLRFNVNENINLPAVKAAAGSEGIVDGFDYRGVEVMAEVRPVPNSPWFMVARMDKSELYSPFKTRLSIIILIIFLLVISSGSLIGFIWRHQRVKYFQQQYSLIESLQKADENLSITLNSIGDGVISTDASGNVVHMNPIAQELCGWKSNEAKGKPLVEVFKIVNAETRRVVENPVKMVMDTGKIIGLANHTVLISKDGSEYQIADSAAPIKDENGNIRGVVLVFSDVTKEYATQEELKANEKFLRDTQKIAQLGSYTLDIGNNIWSSSEILDEVFGIESNFDKSIVGWASIIHPEWQQLMTDYYMNEVVGQGKRFVKEYKIIRKLDGKERWVHGYGELVFNDENKPIKMIGTIQDITERKTAEENIRKSENNLSITLNSIGDGVISTDAKGNVLRMNPVAEKLCGWNLSEAQGKPLEEIFRLYNSDTHEQVDNPVKLVMEKGEVVGLANHTVLISKTGNEYQIADSAAPIKDEDGTIQGVVLVFSDVTQEYAVQKALVESESRLIRGEFIAGFGNWELDFSNKIMRGSKGAGKIYGLNENEWTLEYVQSLPLPEYREKLDRALRNLIELNEPYDVEFKIRRKTDGKIIDIHSTAHYDKDKNTLFGIIQDMTELKRIEQALQHQVLALTMPMDDTTEIHFEDLFNLQEIQKIQDSFSNATGVASLITTPDGVPITKPSNFCTLCNDIIRKTEKGLLNCYKSDAMIGRQNESGPIIQNCLSGGLIDAGASITVGGKHIANWLIGQVRNDEVFDDEILSYANEIGADPVIFEKALREVPIMSKEKFAKVAEALFTFSKELSLIAYQNIQQARFISDRSIALQNLKTSEEKYRSIIEQASEGIFIVDESGCYIDVNPSGCSLLGYSKEELLRKNAAEITNSTNSQLGIKDHQERKTNLIEREMICKDGKIIQVEISMEKISNGYSLEMVRDITERKRMEEEREITLQLLAIINVQNNSKKLLEEVGSLMKQWSFCESIGIRLRENDDYPYFITEGFDNNFEINENSLCSVNNDGEVNRDSEGNPVLECMCGNVLKGRFNSSKPFFTEHGSFWTNSTSELLNSTTEEDRQSRTRNRCHGEGYESVALIPLRTGGETLGLLQFNDRQKNRFTIEKIMLFERLADNLAIALSQKNAQTQLRRSELKHRTLFETMFQGVVYSNNEGKIIDANLAAENILGVNYDELQKYYVYDETWQSINEDGTKYRMEEFPVIKAINTGSEIKNVVMGIINQTDNTRRWLNINAIPQFEAGEQTPKQVLTTFEDITERKLANEKIHDSLKEKEVLLREIHHRVKNNFQVINSLLSLQSNLYTDEEILNIFRDSQSRIKSMSLIHELVYKADNFNYLNLENYISSLIEYLKLSYSMRDDQITVISKIDKIDIQLDDLIPLGLILNELISNTYKHAYPDGRKGTVHINIKKDTDDHHIIIVRDDGIGLPEDFNSPDRKTLGTFLINSLVKQIKGELIIRNKEPGTEFLINFRNGGMTR